MSCKGPNTDGYCLANDIILMSTVLQRTEYCTSIVYSLAKDRILTSRYCLAKDRMLTSTVLQRTEY